MKVPQCNTYKKNLLFGCFLYAQLSVCYFFLKTLWGPETFCFDFWGLQQEGLQLGFFGGGGGGAG